MIRDTATGFLQKTMREYAARTGLDPASDRPRRYLWTDAYAVCTYLDLFRLTGDAAYRALALALVGQVHHTLGRHRDDDPRAGWISDLPAAEGEEHPTAGGLRIGKKMNERAAGEPFDERLEWDRDGQYYHYLTKWMHALSRVAAVTGDPVYLRWAMELARVAHEAFTYAAGGGKRMYWKMSIDLSRPLVHAMGQHDPLDGLVTYSELQAAVKNLPGTAARIDLAPGIADMAGICRKVHLVTDDPLGIGGLLFDATRIARLMIEGEWTYAELLESVLGAAGPGLVSFAQRGVLRHPAAYRLAFRELGLAVGLAGVPMMLEAFEEHPDAFAPSLQRQAQAIAEYLPLGEAIREFWLDEKNRQAATWTEHREINTVMLATSLAPGEFLMV
ncbi:hypothetical protein FGU65_05005 [Methanoculleus sp. FWC-SCC1]|uniref:Uncharacterized protein n=1 Tax=Methanoculleus frigidifontis TaxID=2584085 RepID=A0ABT8M8K4_9EURY|nr:hypothetical protein [Methanoculleus sp. FWC-SCC1]MDN7024254.1 hypothetical protein [Methanoculleus sp. FWC-SCC1]